MKLNQITKLLSILILSVFFIACNGDSEVTSSAASADAQVYSFSLKAIPRTSIDTVNFPILAKTKFSIDQSRSLIYNPDSLPYLTRLTKYYVGIAFVSSTSPSKLELIYPNDSVVSWNGSDSVDFSVKRLYPRLRVKAANGTTFKEYTIDIRIHKVDPDSIIWKQMTSFPATIGTQKTILKDNTFYTFSVKSGAISLYTADKSTLTWSSPQTVSGLSASSLVLESIFLLNGTFFAVDNTKKAYSSQDGKSWTLKNSNIYSILGVLPEKTAQQDSLLVITENSGVYSFAKTANLQVLRTVNVTGNNSAVVDQTFPARGFSSAVSYDRTNINNNILALTGGTDFSGALKNTVWSMRADDNTIEVMPSQRHTVFEAKAGISSFVYDGYLYALTQNLFFKTDSWGYKWVKAAAKQNYPGQAASGQTVIVDNNNYIWIFGGVSSNNTPIKDIWRGKINKLNP